MASDEGGRFAKAVPATTLPKVQFIIMPRLSSCAAERTMKGKPGIPDAGTTRALMTGCGQQIDYIVRSGMARSAKVRAVIEPQQRRVAAPPYNERPQDEVLWMPGRDSLTFGRNSTARSRSKKPY